MTQASFSMMKWIFNKDCLLGTEAYGTKCGTILFMSLMFFSSNGDSFKTWIEIEIFMKFGM